MLATKPDRGASRVSPIIVVGRLRNASGLGAVARSCHDALRDAGLDVYGIDISRALMCEEDFPQFKFRDGRKIEGRGTALMHVSGDLLPLAIAVLGRRWVREKRVIAHWFWELSRLPKEWRVALPFIHEIWVNSQFVLQAVKAIGAPCDVSVVPMPIKFSSKADRVADGFFRALVIFNVASGFARKNPCAAIRAFKTAFGDDPSATLLVQFSNSSHWPEAVRQMQAAIGGATNIVLQESSLTDEGIDDLYAQSDVVLSLHRAEGFGLVPAEAMLRGKPVIVTDWSGTKDFVSSAHGCPVGYRLVEVNDPQSTYRDEVWAEPDEQEAARLLQKLRSDKVYREEIGQRAAEYAARAFAPERFVRAISGTGVERCNGYKVQESQSGR